MIFFLHFLCYFTVQVWSFNLQPTVPASNIPDFQSVLKTHVLGFDLFHSQFK
ncbi:hypothetical protein Hanom_Chr04g00311661 [Helianthus anomalus]